MYHLILQNCKHINQFITNSHFHLDQLIKYCSYQRVWQSFYTRHLTYCSLSERPTKSNRRPTDFTADQKKPKSDYISIHQQPKKDLTRDTKRDKLFFQFCCTVLHVFLPIETKIKRMYSEWFIFELNTELNKISDYVNFENKIPSFLKLNFLIYFF